MSTGTSQCFKCGEVCDEETLCSCISADKDKTEVRVWYVLKENIKNGDAAHLDIEDAHKSLFEQFVEKFAYDQLTARVEALEAAVDVAEKELACLYSVLSEDEMHDRRTSYTQWFAALEHKVKRQILKGESE